MDTELYTYIAGDGFPLFMLHGNGESGEYFKGQIEYFSQFYKVIVPDTRGHGKSGRGREPLVFSTLADDLLYLFDKLGIEKAHLLGFSDGGNTAVTFALRHPERISKLILNGANLSFSGLTAGCRLSIAAQYMMYSAISVVSQKFKSKKELFSLMVNEPRIPADSLKALDVRTLVIAGTHDMIKRSHTELIASSLPNSELLFMEGSHFIAYENSSAFNRVLHDFLLSPSSNS